MYVCMYVCIICMYACMYVCMYVCMCIYACVYIYIYIEIPIYGSGIPRTQRQRSLVEHHSFWKSNFGRWLGTAQQDCLFPPLFAGQRSVKTLQVWHFQLTPRAGLKANNFLNFQTLQRDWANPQALQGDVGEPTLSPKCDMLASKPQSDMLANSSSSSRRPRRRRRNSSSSSSSSTNTSSSLCNSSSASTSTSVGACAGRIAGMAVVRVV